MEGVSRLEPLKADTSEISLLSPFVTFRLLPALRGEHALGLSFGHSERWVYHIHNQPVGLLIISIIPQTHTGVLEWLFVHEKHRNQGIASSLFTVALETLRQLKIQVLSLNFPKNSIDSPVIEALLKKFGWAPSKIFVKKYKFNPQGFNPKWLSRDLPIPSGFSLFPWIQMTSKEKDELEHRFDQYRIPMAVNPFGNPDLLDSQSSVGIRSKDRIVGWAVNHWMDQNSIECSSLYLEPELSSTGLGIAALIQSIRLIKMNPKVEYAWMTIRTNDESIPTWGNFIQKRLAQETLEIQEIHETFLMIS